MTTPTPAKGLYVAQDRYLVLLADYDLATTTRQRDAINDALCAAGDAMFDALQAIHRASRTEAVS